MPCWCFDFVVLVWVLLDFVFGVLASVATFVADGCGIDACDLD